MYQAVFEIIADDIKTRILSGAVKYGEMLPSENKLCAHYKVSRTTIRHSLNILQKNNFVVPVPGKGYVVIYEQKSGFYLHFDAARTVRSSEKETHLLAVNIIQPDLPLANKLHIELDKWVVNIKKIFYSGDVPVGFDDRFINYRMGIPIVENEINFTIVSDIFSKSFPIRTMDWTLNICPQKADSTDAKLLDIAIDAPIAVVEQSVHGESEGIVEWARTIYRADYFEITGNSTY